MDGRHYFKKGEVVQVYLSNKPNLFEGRLEKRIGEAKIEKVITCKVKDLTEQQAKACGHSSLIDLKNALKKWYNANNRSLVTLIKFKLELL